MEKENSVKKSLKKYSTVSKKDRIEVNEPFVKYKKEQGLDFKESFLNNIILEIV